MSKSVLVTLYRVWKCLIDSLSVLFEVGAVLTWYSDEMITAPGWRICFEDSEPTTDVAPWTQVHGDCEIESDGQCVTSPRWPDDYPNNGRCSISVRSAGLGERSRS